MFFLLSSEASEEEGEEAGEETGATEEEAKEPKFNKLITPGLFFFVSLFILYIF